MKNPLDLFKRNRRSSNKAEQPGNDQPYDGETTQWSQMESENLVIVMGVTGTGKSYFINQLKAGSVKEGHGLRSQTKTCSLVHLKVGACTVAAVDTPGFDDDEDSDAVVLEKITRFLTAQHHLRFSLKGIILLHRITSTRMSGSEKRYLNTVRRICGADAFSNVALVTTMWNSVDAPTGLRRDDELQLDYWNDLIAKGANVYQFNGSPDQARTIVGQMLTKDDVVLQIQKELSEKRKKLDGTDAGADIAAKLDRQLDEGRKIISRLNDQIIEAEAERNHHEAHALKQELKEQRARQLRQIEARDALKPCVGDEMDKQIEKEDRDKKAKGEKWTSRLPIFAAVLGPLVTITTQIILPMAGVC